jgi:hypothetical protein
MRHHLVDVLGLKKKSIGFGLYSVPLGRGTKDEVKRWDGGILVDFAAPECQLKQIHPEEHQPADFFSHQFLEFTSSFIFSPSWFKGKSAGKIYLSVAKTHGFR